MLACKVLVCTALLVACVWGHGMVMDPPNRSSMWRFFPGSPQNYNDNENFCGGYGIQWQTNGGKCGVCGDDYRDKIPRKNENTGTYGQGKIAKEYTRGSVIKVDCLLTANHRGSFFFDICITPKNQPEQDICFQKLRLATGEEKYVVPNPEKGMFSVQLQLPSDLTCDQCTLRWTYVTGNTWGHCEDGHDAVGCGPQETFRSCSDIKIV